MEHTVFLAPIRWEVDVENEQANSVNQVAEACPPDELFVPPQFRDRLITWAHTSLTSGQPGETRTFQLLSGRYWWENMRLDIHRFVSSCTVCSMCETPHTLPAGKLLPLPVPSGPWSHIAVDFVTDLPDSQQQSSLLSSIDSHEGSVLSRFPNCLPPFKLQSVYLIMSFASLEYLRMWCLTEGSSSLPKSRQHFCRGSVEHWMRTSEQVWEQTHQHIEAVIQQHKHHTDRRRGDPPVYALGNLVWLSTRDFRLSEGCKKLIPKYIGSLHYIHSKS